MAEQDISIKAKVPTDDTIILARRMSVCGESYDPTEDNDPNFSIQYPKPPEDKEMIGQVLKCVWLTKEMDFDQKEAIIDGMVQKTYKPGEILYDVGQPAERFYVVKSGKFEAYEWQVGMDNGQSPRQQPKIARMTNDGCTIEPCEESPGPNTGIQSLVKVKRFEKGDFFGEIALLYDPPRAMKVTSSTESGEPNCTYEIQRHLFRKLAVQRAYQKRKKLEELVEKCSVFEHLSDKEKDKVVNAMKVTSYADRDVIVSREESLTGMYFVLKGKVKIRFIEGKNGIRKELIANPGQWIGEISLLVEVAKMAGTSCSLEAVGRVITGYLKAADFEKMLGKNSIQRNSKKYEELVTRAIHFTDIGGNVE